MFAGSTPHDKLVENEGDDSDLYQHNDLQASLNKDTAIEIMRDMLRETIHHTPERRVDRQASTPLERKGMDAELRKTIYTRLLELAADPTLLPLTVEDANSYLDSIKEHPLQPNTLFPPDEIIFARNIKTIRQYSVVLSSHLCNGRGLWLKPNMNIPKGTFMGIYAGWIIDNTEASIWDMEDLDKSYSLGLIGSHYVENDGTIKQAIIHAQDRSFNFSQELFTLACANEWIWHSPNMVDQNMLRFGKMGMVFTTRQIVSSQTRIELTIGLGREGTPFTGWTNYKKTLMLRLLEVLHIVILEAQSLDIALHMKWQLLLEELRDTLDLIRYNTLDLLRTDRSALAILLAGVENESEIDKSISIIYNNRESTLDNLRRLIQHAEVRKRCNFRYADRPRYPSSASAGTNQFWRKLVSVEMAKSRPELEGSRRSQRITQQSFSETNVVVLIDSAGQRRRISTIPMALLPEGSIEIGSRIENNSLFIHEGIECVAIPSLDDAPNHCSVRFEDGSCKMIHVQELDPPAPGDFFNAKWTMENKSMRIDSIASNSGCYGDKFGGERGTATVASQDHILLEQRRPTMETRVTDYYHKQDDHTIDRETKSIDQPELEGQDMVARNNISEKSGLTKPQGYGFLGLKMYGEDYRIVEEQFVSQGLTLSRSHFQEFANEYGASLVTPQSSTLRIGTWNASGLKSIRKLRMLIALMMTASIDILCIQDTRIEPGIWSEELIKTAKEDLGPGSTVLLAPVSARATGTMGANVGGQLILKSPRAGVVTNFWMDASTLGVVCSFDIQMGGADLRVVSLYVPPDRGAVSAVSDGGGLTEPISTFDSEFMARGTLTSRLKQFVDLHKSGVSPAEYILSTAQQRIQTHLEVSGTSAICVGDFNANGSRKSSPSINGQIGDWAKMVGLLNATSILSPQGDCPSTFYRQGVGVSDIDHILFTRDRGLLPIGWRVLDESLWLTLSNHCPLIIDFEVPQFNEVYSSRRKRRRRQQRQTLDIPRKVTNETDKAHRDIDMYRKYLTRLNQTPSPDIQIRFADIMKVTKSALLSISRRRRKSTLWSPEVVALTANQIAVTEMGRYLDGLKGRHQWKKQDHIDHGMNVILNNWEQQIVKLVDSDKHMTHDKTYWLNFSTRGPEFWKMVSWTRRELTAQVICEKRRLSKLLYQRNRMEWHSDIANKNASRARARLQGKHLRELRSLLGTGHDPFSMEYLIVEDKLILDQSVIHQKVTEHFSNWFKKSGIPWGFHNSDNDFARLWGDKEYFTRAHEGSSIPEHLLNIVWEAMQPCQHTSEEDRESLEILLSATPTLEEFQEAIRTSPTHSAGGPTAVTYNAIAAWDDSLITEVHTILQEMWKDKTVPMCWKWRWLVPIPKVKDNVSLDDLRPLMLTDVTRKLWIGIVVNKIQSYWRKHGLLSDAQHGFLEHKGTEGALLQFRNVLEEARESCTDVFLSSWDVRRAFDRVPKNLLTLGWMRLGVPQSIAEYLVGIDIDGVTMVRTPFAINKWDKEGASGFADLEDCPPEKLAFLHTDTGTGQGNIDSPLNWTSIMDILLRALAGSNSHPFYIRSDNPQGYGLSPAPDIAYADDLISLTSRLDGLQQKADIVCAFCLVFGLEIAIPKLRVYKVHWGGEHTEDIGISQQEGDSPAHFVSIHINNWTCRKVKVNSFESAPPLKYLGVLFDLTNQDSSAKEWARVTARYLMGKLNDRSIDVDLKLDAIVQVIFPKLLYSAQFSSWSLREYVQLDELFSPYFRQFLGLKKSFPAELLYAPEDQCGIGLPRFSNEAHSRKIAVLFRGYQSDTATKHATASLLLRGLRIQNCKPLYTQSAILSPTGYTQPIFIRSITEWLNIAQLRLAKGGQTFSSHSCTNLTEYFKDQGSSLTEEQIKVLEANGISTIGDIVTSGFVVDSLRRGRSRSRGEATSSAQALVGRKIAKEFPNYGIFEGTVQSFLYPWFTVKYKDGDCEEMTLTELLPLIEDNGEVMTTLRWIPFHGKQFSFLQDLVPPLPPDISSIIVMNDQCYLSDNIHYPMDRGWIWEVLGQENEKICIRTWQYKGLNCPIQGDRVTLESLSLGAATEIWLPKNDMFRGQDDQEGVTYRVLLGPDVNKKKIHRLVLCIFQQPRYSFGIMEMEIPLLTRLFEEIPHLQNTQCFTDGSLHQDLNPVVEAVIPPSTTSPYRQLGASPSSSGALVARRRGAEAMEPSELIIRVTQGEEANCGNSYDIELILLTLGCVLRWMAAVFASPCVILDLFSDCKSAIDKANLTDQMAIRHLGHKEHGLLLRQIYDSRFASDIKVSHVYGHPERLLGPEDSWQHLKGEDAGIYLADKAASPTILTLESTRPIIETTTKEVLMMMRCLQECVIIREEGTPILEDPKALIQHYQFCNYLTQRDKDRTLKRWTKYIRDAPRISLPCSNSYSVRARRTKIVFNWYNREEQIYKDKEQLLCPLCSVDIERDTERHLYSYCQDVDIENIRLETMEKLRLKVLGDGTYSPILAKVLSHLFLLLTESLEKHLLWKGVIPIDSWKELVDLVPAETQWDRRAIIMGIRDMLRLTGDAVKAIRKSYWLGRSLPPPPSLLSSSLSQGQAEYLSQRTQQRLPTLWGIMTPKEQIDWEVRRRLKRKNSVEALPLKRRKDPLAHSLITSYMTLIPAKIVINKLLLTKQ